ncbi:helix-turn-helix transcriptional regulator [Leifsonia sp. fls2-241-R2A-40a]|uniref:helix-turn-helix transcriptional regulator n=1 Tax=Leifsonia sp. fls2-241-R2A-40a TaxID=3040290 RepID=UPI00255010E9|nr:helix-turn-helix transcriptional regulator [Leifsonia sp. fls2-241-R2A-40a]
MPGTFHTRDVAADTGEAEQILRRSYGEVSLAARTRENGLSYAEELWGDERMLLGRHRFGGELSLSFGLPFIAVGSARGSYRWQAGDQDGDLTAAPALFQPEIGARGDIAVADVTVVALEVRSVRRTARALFGEDDLVPRFVAASPVSPQLARQWRAVHDLAWRQLRDGAFESPLLRASLYRQLAVGMLETFPLAGDHDARRTTVASRAVAFKRAVQYIDEHASLPITADDIALAAGTSVPELVRAFDMHLPFSPQQYLRSVRLSAAHRDLMEADPTRAVTVTDVASRWGFADERTFTRLYLERFGQPPHRTLSREG